MSSEKDSKFASELWDGFEIISKHTANEIQFCKDVWKFFKKRREIEEEYAKNLSKLGQKSQYTVPLGSLNHAWTEVLQRTQKVGAIHAATATQFGERVCDPVQSLIKDLETSRKQLCTEGIQLNAEYANNVEALKKAKVAYEKASKEFEVSGKTLDAAKTEITTKPKDLLKLEKDKEKKQQTATMLEEAYKKRVEDTNGFLEQYYSEKMPRILNEFEHLETVRIHMLKEKMKKYVIVLDSIPPLLQTENKELLSSIELINQDADIELFIKQNKTNNEVPMPFEYEPYVQGNVPDVKKVRSSFMRKILSSEGPVISTAGQPNVKANAVFAVPLEKLMERQKEKYPNLDVPILLPILSFFILKMNGLKTEGIFRVPANANDVKFVRDKFDEGDYAVTNATNNVHTPCALMKLWLRELPEPIIPVSHYEMCTETPEKAMEIFRQLPPLSQNVVSFIINFLQELSKPENVETTKMSKENLAMVFAPSFLRCPYTDYNRALTASEKEKEFVLFLIERISRAKAIDFSVAPSWLVDQMESFSKQEKKQDNRPPPPPFFSSSKKEAKEEEEKKKEQSNEDLSGKEDVKPPPIPPFDSDEHQDPLLGQRFSPRNLQKQPGDTLESRETEGSNLKNTVVPSNDNNSNNISKSDSPKIPNRTTRTRVVPSMLSGTSSSSASPSASNSSSVVTEVELSKESSS